MLAPLLAALLVGAPTPPAPPVTGAGAPSDGGARPATTSVDPAASDVPPLFVVDEELNALAARDVAAARPLLRRSARSAAAGTTRALAIRLLATYDAGSASARICARALRVDVDPFVRRTAAECLGRLGHELTAPHTPALVSALDDANLDVITMAGWALANAGDAAAIGAVVKGASHPDKRVAQLFDAYVDRLQTRLGLVARPEQRVDEVDADGRRLVPAAAAMLGPVRAVDTAASTAWLGLYGGMTGWFHGAFLLSAHGGVVGAEAAALGGLGGAAVGAAAASAYGFTRADSWPRAHTVVQLGTLGTFAGFGAGLLSGFPPTSAVAAANLSFIGTLAGTAAGVALVETRPPTLGALGAGLVSSVAFGTAAGAVWGAYGAEPQFSTGAALFVGSIAGAGATFAAADSDIGLFPLVGGAAGGLLGAGTSAALFFVLEAGSPTEATGWAIAGSTLAGTALGALGGSLIPDELDPFQNPAVRLTPPTLGGVPGARGATVPTATVALFF